MLGSSGRSCPVPRWGQPLLVTIRAPSGAACPLAIAACRASTKPFNQTPALPAMRRRTTAYSIVAALCMLQLGLAMVVAPFGCEMGLAVYASVGVVVVLLLLALPFARRRDFQRHMRTPAALSFAMVFLFIWLIGWFVGFANSDCQF